MNRKTLLSLGLAALILFSCNILYSQVSPPTISNISPSSGYSGAPTSPDDPSNGGQLITISGSNFGDWEGYVYFLDMEHP